MNRRNPRRFSLALDTPRPLLGFTLIEIIVVVAIMGVIMGGSIAGYRRFNERQKLLTTGKELLVNLRRAQAKATSGVKTNVGCNNQVLVGYRVQSFTQNRYTLSQVCVVAGVQSFYAISTIDLPTGALVETNFDVTFLGQSGGVRAGSALPLTIRIKPASQTANCNASIATCYDIQVNSTGSVDDLGF